MYGTIIYGEMTQLKPQYVLMWLYIIFTNLGYDNECQSCEEMCVPGGRLNKKDGLTRYGDSHVKDKTS